jgi:hypothetical protein
VTQYDVELVHSIEALTQRPLEACDEVTEEEVVQLLNPVAKATRAARMRLMQTGFDDKVAEHARRKKKAAKERRRDRSKTAKKQRAR